VKGPLMVPQIFLKWPNKELKERAPHKKERREFLTNLNFSPIKSPFPEWLPPKKEAFKLKEIIPGSPFLKHPPKG